jgi:ribonuclease BN (tRNA processing enzyme)
MPLPERWGSGSLLEVGDEWLMIDCGPASTHKMYQMGIPSTEIDHLFFTHYHSDHMSDYACFLMTRFDMSIGVEADLNVYGPPPIKDITERLWSKEMGIFWLDVVARTQHPKSVREYHRRRGAGPRPQPTVNVYELQEGGVASGKNWECYVYQVDHAQPYLESLGYRFETEEGVIAFTGDAELNDKVLELGRGADMLVINALGGVADAARAAKMAGAKHLTLVHQPYGLDADETIEEAKQLFDGQVYGAKDQIEICWSRHNDTVEAR